MRRARGSDSIDSRYSTGSMPARSASSSMKHSIANTFGNAPRPRNADVRTGGRSTRWWITRLAGKSYSGNALRVPPPPLASGGSVGRGSGGGVGSASWVSRLPPVLGRCTCVGDQISVVQSRGFPASSSAARSVTCIAGPNGSKPNSSSRRHCTRMQWSGSCIAITAASTATSSAPLWP